MRRECLSQRSRLNRLAGKWMGQEDEAQDLVQETYLRALRAFRAGRGCRGDACWWWLRQIMTNLNIDGARWEAGRPEVRPAGPEEIERLAAHAWSASTPVDLDGQICGGDIRPNLSGSLLRALDRLPEGFRQVLVLSYLEGRSCSEISVLLHIPPGTVMSRRYRARRRLRRILEEEGYASASGRVAGEEGQFFGQSQIPSPGTG